MTTLTRETTAQLPQVSEPRNPGMDLDLDWVRAVQANTSAIERRAATLPGRRSVKKDWQAAWLCRAISLIDLTTLSGDDTADRVRRLCAKARQPVRADLLDALGMDGLTVGAVCVYHDLVATAVDALQGTNIPGAAVSSGFPAGLSQFHLRVAEIGESVKAGAKEIDIVISRRLVLGGDWQALYDEMRTFRDACGDAHVKAILATDLVRCACRPRLAGLHDGGGGFHQDLHRQGKRERDPAREPGDDPRHTRLLAAHWVSRGLQTGGRDFQGEGCAGVLSLMKDELGDRWLQPDMFRFKQSLLGDISGS